MKKLLIALTMVVLMVCGLLCACRGVKDPSNPSTPNASAPAPTQTDPVPSSTPDDPYILNEIWEMYGAFVNDKGEVVENVKISARVRTWHDEETGYDMYELWFDYPENVYHQSAWPSTPNPNSPYPYPIRDGMSGDRTDINAPPVWFYVSFDLAKECFIVDFDDGKDVYLMVSKDPNASIAELWEHFQGFFVLHPGEWPEIKVNG